MEIAWQCEIDDYCQKILALRYPDSKKYRDIKTLKGSELEEVDIITGGFPCQDISKGGNGIGIEGKRSGLWKEMYRIICEVGPKYVVVENVSAILGRGLGVVLKDLAAIGYDCEWDCIPASTFGAPHLRDRTFIVAYANSQRHIYWEVRRFPTKDWLQTLSNFSTSREPRVLRGKAKTGRWEIEKYKWFCEPSIQRVVDGDASTIHRLKMLGNGQVPACTYVIGKMIMDIEKGLI